LTLRNSPILPVPAKAMRIVCFYQAGGGGMTERKVEMHGEIEVNPLTLRLTPLVHFTPGFLS
jgi:hypothetical protein